MASPRRPRDEILDQDDWCEETLPEIPLPVSEAAYYITAIHGLEKKIRGLEEENHRLRAQLYRAKVLKEE